MHTASSSLRALGPSSSSSSFCCERDFLFVTYSREKKNARGILCVRYYIHNGTRPFFTKILRCCWCSFFLFFLDFFQTCSNQRKTP